MDNQELRMWAIQMVVAAGSANTQEGMRTAQAFYDFVKNGEPEVRRDDSSN